MHNESVNSQRVTVIQPCYGWAGPGFRELWNFRDLLLFLVLRDIRVRYKQAVLGAAWAILQPFTTMVVFSVFFGSLARIPSGDVPYPLLAFTALVPWGYFATAVSTSANSVLNNRGIITKVYFPRLLLPLASMLAGLVDFAIALLILVCMIFWYGGTLGGSALYLPAFILLEVALTLALGLWLSALIALYRDFIHVLPFLLQTMLFASPVAYPSSLVPEEWRLLYGLNPLVGLIDGYRWALLGHGDGPGPMLWVSVAAVLVLLATGFLFFHRMEGSFVDHV